MVEVSDLLDRITSAGGIEGVTFLGGEPFDQAPALAALAQSVQDAHLSVMTFTGYEFEVLRREQRPAWDDLLAATDLLVDGPFVRLLPDRHRPWVGSTNQQFRFLSPRYRHLADELGSIPDRLEVRLRPDGTVLINGMASPRVLNDLTAAVGVGDRSLQSVAAG